MPGVKQAWPMVAACWSPATPRIGIARAEDRRLGRCRSRALQSRTSGSIERGTLKSFSRSSSQAPLAMSYSSVREALVASVACTLPPVSRQSRKVSTVPKARWPASASARAPSTWSSSQAILVAEK